MRLEDAVMSSGALREPEWSRSIPTERLPENECLSGRHGVAPLSWDIAATPEVLLAEAERVAVGLGFTHVAYLLNSPLPLSSPQCLVIGNLPVACGAGDVALAFGSLVRRCRATLRPVVWDDTVFEPAPAFHAALRDAGVHGGWSQVVRGTRGKWGVFTAFRSGTPLAVDELQQFEPRLVWLAQIIHHHLAGACLLRYPDKGDVKLSDLEKSILRWTIDGKTAGELAEILELSTRTVNFHVQNVLAKLNACNKTSAATQAALLELLD